MDVKKNIINIIIINRYIHYPKKSACYTNIVLILASLEEDCRVLQYQLVRQQADRSLYRGAGREISSPRREGIKGTNPRFWKEITSRRNWIQLSQDWRQGIEYSWRQKILRRQTLWINRMRKIVTFNPACPLQSVIVLFRQDHFEISATTLSNVAGVNPNPVPVLASSRSFSSLISGAMRAKIGWIPKI